MSSPDPKPSTTTTAATSPNPKQATLMEALSSLVAAAKNHGKTSIEYAKALKHYGKALTDTSQLDKAIKAYNEAIPLFSDHGEAFEFGLTSAYLASLLEAKLEFNDARRHYRVAANVFRSSGNGLLVPCLKGIANCDISLKDFRPALETIQVVIDILKDNSRFDSAEMREILTRRVIALTNLERWKEAEQTLKSVLQIDVNQGERKSIKSAEIHRGLAHVYWAQRKWDGALSRFRKAREIFEEFYGPKHDETLFMDLDMAGALSGLKKWDAATAMVNKSLADISAAGKDQTELKAKALEVKLNILVSRKDAIAEAEETMKLALTLHDELKIQPSGQFIGAQRELELQKAKNAQQKI